MLTVLQEQKPLSQDLMENLLNGKNIDEIPEFQPGSTPTKMGGLGEEFHFGPNAAPFTPGKLMDQSEAGLSTKAEFGDETGTLDTSLDTSQDNVDFKKEEDPMSMSFYQDKDSHNVDPFEVLNTVQMLPDNLEEFLNKSDPEPSNDVILNNDQRIQTTDLDNEKELASPVSNDDDSSGVCELSKSPQPQTEDLLIECSLPKETLPDVCLQPDLTPQSESPLPPALSPEPKMVAPPGDDLPVLSPPVLSPEPSECQISKSPELSESLPKTSEPSEQLIDVAPEKEVSIESPLEDITSSVKDILSPVVSPVPDQILEEIKPIEATAPPLEASSPIREQNLLSEVPLSTPKSVTDTESVATADVNSFLERSQIVDLASPLISPRDQTVVESGDFDPLSKCVYPLPTDIKTENIVPEFPEAAVLSPTESKEESVPIKEPEIEKKPKPKTSLAKKPAPAKPTTASPTKAKPSTTTPKTRPTPPVRTSTGAVPKQPASKTLPRPRPAPKTTKPPLTNGDVKPPVRTIRKSLDSPKPPITKTASKASPTTRPVSAPAPKSTVTKTSVTAPKPRPTTLNKTTTSTATKTTSTVSRVNTTTKPATTMSSPKPRPTTAPAKPRVPLSKTVGKTTDSEKQNKDSANKLTASRTVTRTTGTTSARTMTGTVRKTETKVNINHSKNFYCVTSLILILNFYVLQSTQNLQYISQFNFV